MLGLLRFNYQHGSPLTRVYLDNGEIYNPPQPSVRPMMTECCTFTKSSSSPTGACGVLMYDIIGRLNTGATESLAIMFSVPWDYNLFKNWFALGIYKQERSCDGELFKEMYKGEEQNHDFVRAEAVGSGINYVGANHDIKATMTSLGKAIMKVEVWEKLFTPMGQQSL